MDRIQRAMLGLLWLTLGGAAGGCQQGANLPGILFGLALSIGVAVGTYYLTKAITD